MPIELSNITFTDQADVVPVSGVEKIYNTSIANTLAGDDIINGESGDRKDRIPNGSGHTYPMGGIVNIGTLNTDNGNDRLTGLSNPADPNPRNWSSGYGIYNEKGIIDTGDGNDILTGLVHSQNLNAGFGIYNQQGIINTGEGEDTIIATPYMRSPSGKSDMDTQEVSPIKKWLDGNFF
jgi:hypothetical protein